LRTSSTKINRRQAIGIAAACCGGIRVDSANAAQRIEPPINFARRIRSFHLELLLFNHELVPQFLTDREEPSTNEAKRARRFLAVSLYLRRLLDRRGGGAPVSIDEAKLSGQLRKLNVGPSLACQSLHSWMRAGSDTDWLSNEATETGHSIVSSSRGAQSHSIQESAMRLCNALKKPANARSAVVTVRNAGDDDIRLALESTAPMDYLELVEPLFLIRPATPVSMLAIHSTETEQTDKFRGMLSAICRNLMERLAYDHFDQSLAIGQLQQCDAKRHPSTLSDVFGVLLEKWLVLIRDNRGFKSDQYWCHISK